VADVGFKQAMTLKLVRLVKGAEPSVLRTVRFTPCAARTAPRSRPSRARPCAQVDSYRDVVQEQLIAVHEERVRARPHAHASIARAAARLLA
jgi:hypothetical protein